MESCASQRPLVPGVTSVTSVANDKGDNEMILGAMHRSPGKPQKTLARRPSDEGLCDQSSPQMGPFLPNEVLRIAQNVRKREEKK